MFTVWRRVVHTGGPSWAWRSSRAADPRTSRATWRRRWAVPAGTSRSSRARSRGPVSRATRGRSTPVSTCALEAPDPMRADPPMHPSFEDRPGAPDRVFAALDDDEFERQVAAWCRALQSVDAANADVLHLHHLTPLNEAAARVAPGVPIVGHLHGTELLMLEAIEDDPERWPHSAAWAARMRQWAAACERLILLSDTQEARAEDLLGIDARRCVLVPNGFDPAVFRPRHIDHGALWRRYLVDEPRGWAPGEGAGTVRYEYADLDVFEDAEGETPVLLYVGRFTEVKRVP